MHHDILSIGLVVIAIGMVLALGLSWLVRRLQARTGLSSDVEVVASDTGQNRVQQMWDPVSGLAGKPDYVLRESVHGRSCLVPVEVKPTRKGRQVYESDEMQLTVYMILLRATYPDEFAGYGYVRYATGTFTVELTPEREARCLAYAQGVRAARKARVVHRSHKIKGRCAGCSLRDVCGEALLSADPPRSPQPRGPRQGRRPDGARPRDGA